MRSYVDPRTGNTITTIFQSEYHVTAAPGEVISTILGSCIAVCLRDPEAGVGGMNHFLLPGDMTTNADAVGGQAMRFGCFSMEQLVNGLLSFGGRRECLEAKVFGGGNVSQASLDIGKRNAEFAIDFLRRERLKLAASDVGGYCARRLKYDPIGGRVKLKRVDMEHSVEVFAQEKRVKPEALKQNDDIELFG